LHADFSGELSQISN